MSFTVTGDGPTINSQVINDYAGQYQKALDDRFRRDPLGMRPLEALANSRVVKTKGKNEYTIFTRPFVRVRTSTLDAQRQKSTDNYLTTDPTKGGNIASVPINLKFEDFKLQDTIDFGHEVDLSIGVDNVINDVQTQSQMSHEVYQAGRSLARHEVCLRNFILADEWISATHSVALVTTGAITATATTFIVADAQAAYFWEGQICKIGDKRQANSTGGLEPFVDAILVKTVGAAGSGGGSDTLITIESTAANFPLGYYFDNQGEIFQLLETALNAHTSGVRIQTDTPLHITPSTVDQQILRPILLQAGKAYINTNKLVNFCPLEIKDVMIGKDTPFVENDFLGKNILTNGKIGKCREMDWIAEEDSAKRILTDGQVLLYNWTMERNECFVLRDFLKAHSIAEKIQERANMLLKDTYFEIYGSHTPRSGKIRSLLTSCVTSAFVQP